MPKYNPKKNKNHWILCSAATSLEAFQKLLKHMITKNYNKKEYKYIQEHLFQDIKKDPSLTKVVTLAGVRQNIKNLEHVGLIRKYKGPNKREILEIKPIASDFLRYPREVFTNLFFNISFSKYNYESEVSFEFNINPGLFVLKLLHYIELRYGFENSFLTGEDFSCYIIFVKNEEELTNIGDKIIGSHISNRYPEYPRKNSPLTYKNHGGWIKALLAHTFYIEEHPTQRGAIRLNYKAITQDASNGKLRNNSLANRIIELFSSSDFKVSDFQEKEDLKALRKIRKTSLKETLELLNRFRKITKLKKAHIGTRKYIPMSPLVKAAVKKAAHFICQACKEFSFKDKYGLGYCEPHHIITRAKEGEIDNPDNIVVLCPLCHAKIHHGKENIKKDVYKKLLDKGYIKLSYFERLSKDKRLTLAQLNFLRKESLVSKEKFKQLEALLK